MIKVSGYSDDIVVISGLGVLDDEIGSFEQDTVIRFGDGTVLRMTYDGAWKAVVEHEGNAPYMIHSLLKDDDYYSDEFIIYTDYIFSTKTERRRL